MSFRFPTFSSTHLSNVLGTRSSARAVSFLYALLSWNPSWRSSAQEALRHSYFRINNQHVRKNNKNQILIHEERYKNNTRLEIFPSLIWWFCSVINKIKIIYLYFNSDFVVYCARLFWLIGQGTAKKNQPRSLNGRFFFWPFPFLQAKTT